MQEKQKNLIFIILIIALGATVYANSLKGEFLWDDDYLIKNNVYLKNPAYIGRLFSQHIGAGSGKPSNSYRPLQMLTYALDYSLWKLNVKGYHLTNIILHILAGLSLYWLINLLFKDKLIALFTSLLFIAHPVHTEAVSYISGRADPLSLLFILLCFIFYLKYLKLKNITTYLLMLLAYILALLSREASLILPVLLLLYHYNFKKRFRIILFLPILIITAIYITLRLTILSFPLPSREFLKIPGVLQRLPSFFVAVTEYIRLLFWPFNLHMEYGQKLFSPTHPQAILGLIILLAIVIYAARKRTKSPWLSFSLFWFALTLLPVSNIYFINAYMAEHWLYLPSIGFFLILAQGLNRLYKKEQLKTPALILTLALLAFYSYLTVNQNNYWQNPLTFYETTLKYAPDSQRVHLNLANTYLAGDRVEQAVAHYKKALAVDPNYAEVYNNLGVIYHKRGEKESALAYYQKAIELNPDYAEACNNLAKLYGDMGKRNEAVELYKKAIAAKPGYLEPYVGLGIEYYRMGKVEESIDSFKQAIAIDPTYANAYNNLAVAYYKQGKYKLAIEYLDQATQLGAQNPILSAALQPHR